VENNFVGPFQEILNLRNALIENKKKMLKISKTNRKIFQNSQFFIVTDLLLNIIGIHWDILTGN